MRHRSWRPAAGGLLVLCATAIPCGLGAAQFTPARGEAIVWYLGHCGCAVRTQNHLLIFDYQETRDGPAPKTRPARPALDAGFIAPEELKDLPVRVFASHSHADHYDPIVLEWRRAAPDIQYFFAWKVSEDTTLHGLVGPRAEWKSGGLEIATVNSHHSGVPEVAWLVQVDGLVLYHNGDCQPAFENDYRYLQTRTARIDLAFVPGVFEDKWHYGRQNADLFRRFRPRAVFPMHDTAGSPGYREAARAWRERHPQLAVFVPERLGDRFEFRGGTATRAPAGSRR